MGHDLFYCSRERYDHTDNMSSIMQGPDNAPLNGLWRDG
jgi:hypothetical protein